jgi:predicted transcriptional regulator
MKAGKAPKDPRGGHVRLYWELVDSPAWRALSHADVRVYLAMRRKLGSTNNGNINATLAEMRHAGISSSSTLSSALHRLEALGFIEKTRQGGIAAGGKVCSLYRFSDESTYDIPKVGVQASKPINGWKAFDSIAKAKAAVRIFRRENTSKVRTSNRTDSAIEPESAKAASTVERVVKRPLRKSNWNQFSRKPLEAA